MQPVIPPDQQNPEDQTIFASLGSLSLPEAQPQSGAPPHVNNATIPVASANPPLFYTQEEEDMEVPLVDEQEPPSSPFVMPFQNSAAMPTVVQSQADKARGDLGRTPPAATRGPSLPWLKILLLIGVAVVTLLVGGLLVFAQPAAPQAPTQAIPGATQQISTTTAARHTVVTPTSAPGGHQGTQGTGTTASNLLPSPAMLTQLGWTNAKLSIADAAEVLRTATTFVDREMSVDFRNIGTAAHHSGTLTAATFLLTQGGQARFVHNDVRVINNGLYNKVLSTRLIQQVVNAQAHLVKFQVVTIQGQPQQFAWVTVSFQLLQSQADPTTGVRTESLQTDPATGLPRIHQMSVVLLRVAPETQGAGAPMGGTGWLVNTYELDTATLPAIATDPAV